MDGTGEFVVIRLLPEGHLGRIAVTEAHQALGALAAPCDHVPGDEDAAANLAGMTRSHQCHHPNAIEA